MWKKFNFPWADVVKLRCDDNRIFNRGYSRKTANKLRTIRLSVKFRKWPFSRQLPMIVKPFGLTERRTNAANFYGRQNNKYGYRSRVYKENTVTHTHIHTTTTLQNGNERITTKNQITIRNSIENVPNDTHGYCLCPHPFPPFPPLSFHFITPLFVCVCALKVDLLPVSP